MTRRTQQPGITGLVTTLDEESRLADCLESLAWCDEILVVDSYSRDRTEEIARSFENVRFIQHPYHGAAAQRNWAIPQCRNRWIFLLDADERCPEDLRDEILERIAEPDAPDAFVIRRNVWFLDHRLRFSGWRHDRVARVFKRDECRFQNRRVHPQLITRRGSRPAIRTCPVLSSRMNHHMVESVAEYVDRSRRYGYWAAAQEWKEGRRTRLRQVIDGPLWRFFRQYVLLGGFLDGAPGLVFCARQAAAVFSKRAALWGWARNERRGIAPDLPSFDEDPATWAPPPGEAGAADAAESAGTLAPGRT